MAGFFQLCLCVLVLTNNNYHSCENAHISNESELSDYKATSFQGKTNTNQIKIKKSIKTTFRRTYLANTVAEQTLDQVYSLPFNCKSENNDNISCNVEIKDVGFLIGILPETVEYLTLYLHFNWTGELPKPTEDIVLYNISRLSHLKYLALSPSRKHKGIASLSFGVETFKNLRHMEIFKFNVPYYGLNISLDNIVKCFTNLTELDLSDTSYLGYDSLLISIKAIHTQSLKVMKLRQFQNIGFKGFSPILDVIELFQDFPYLEELDLSMNNLGVISHGLISTLPNLKKLTASYNCLTSEFAGTIYWEIAFHNSLEYVDMSNQINIGLPNGPISEVHFQLENSKLQLQNRKQPLYDQLVVFCLNLYDSQNISNISHNKTVLCPIFKCMGVIYEVIGIIPCSALGVIEFDFSCTFYIRIPILKKMKTMKVNNLNLILAFNSIDEGRICIQNTPLEVFNFSSNKPWLGQFHLSETISKAIFLGVENITSVDFHNNDLEFFFPTNIMVTRSILKHVNLAGNLIKIQRVSLCKYLVNLEILNISSNNIPFIFEVLLMDCGHLKILDLSHNKLTFSTFDISINSLSNIQILDISYNLLSYLPPVMTHQLDALQTSVSPITINFLGNPLVCNCSNISLRFMNWFNTTTVHIARKYQYSCSGSYGLKLVENVDAVAMEHSCNPSYLIQVIITVSSTFLLLLLVLSFGAIYRYRWRIRYLIFTLKNMGFLKKKVSQSELDHWKYDAFISYCAIDRFWVHDVLMKTLEDEYGFKLCIHYRDFPLGEWIADAIVTSIKDSREIIIVISEISLTRPWCQFELEVAFTEARNRNMKVILIKLENISQPIESPAVLWLLENQVNLEWSNNSEGQKLFWTALVSLLYDDSEGGCCCCCKYGRKAITSRHVGQSIAKEIQPLLP